jgi:hypothetical protein
VYKIIDLAARPANEFAGYQGDDVESSHRSLRRRPYLIQLHLEKNLVSGSNFCWFFINELKLGLCSPLVLSLPALSNYACIFMIQSSSMNCAQRLLCLWRRGNLWSV